MEKILVTGATGHIGSETVGYLHTLNEGSEIIAGVRSIDSAREQFSNLPDIKFRHFDFEDQVTFDAAFSDIKVIFLLRPPHLSDVETYFKPLLKAAHKKAVRKIVFLSVQGAENSKVIPHNKIERLIVAEGFDYVFVRPSYFMQNLTSTLLPGILKKRSIILPAGKAKFNWVDAKNVGEACARLILNFDQYKNQALEITGKEKKNFYQVAAIISEVTGLPITYQSINPVSFYFKKKKESGNSGMSLVMTVLHFLPRIQGVPDLSDNYQKLSGKEPTSLEKFIRREKHQLMIP